MALSVMAMNNETPRPLLPAPAAPPPGTPGVGVRPLLNQCHLLLLVVVVVELRPVLRVCQWLRLVVHVHAARRFWEQFGKEV